MALRVLKPAKFSDLNMKHLRSLLAVMTGISCFIFLYYSETGQLAGADQSFFYVFSGFLGWLVGVSIHTYDKQMDRKLPLILRPGLRIGLGFTGSLFIALLLSFGGIYSMMGLYFGFGDLIAKINRSYTDEAVKLIILEVFIFMIYNVVYFTYASIYQYNKGKIERIAAERKQLKLQLYVLKNQLSPHFLFNSLNTISALLYKDIKLSEEFIRRLVQTYQFILNSYEKEVVTLAEELEFVKSYNYLLKVRFENNLDLSINIEEELLQCVLPPLTVQMLVENAVKHNVISDDMPLSVLINSNGPHEIKVENTRTMPKGDIASFKVGLVNIRKRYHYLTSRNIKILDEDNFAVILPILNRVEKVV